MRSLAKHRDKYRVTDDMRTNKVEPENEGLALVAARADRHRQRDEAPPAADKPDGPRCHLVPVQQHTVGENVQDVIYGEGMESDTCRQETTGNNDDYRVHHPGQLAD